MLALNVRNVNHALPLAMMYFKQGDVHVLRTAPRGLKTLEWDTPVTTVYDRPQECVLFDAKRDANPFFHLFESMWILAGRHDVKFLADILPNMANYSDNGHSFHAAYGYRLRRLHGDQLERVAQLLHDDPETRRAVISIWDAPMDLAASSKDIPCNDTVAFRRRNGMLDMTVFNRSNDVIWGAYGANAVQFSFILQWVAGAAGLAVGRYYQVSNSFHVYDNEQYAALKDMDMIVDDPYERDDDPIMPIGIGSPHRLDQDLSEWFRLYDKGMDPIHGMYGTSWVLDTFIPAWQAFQAYRGAKRNGMSLDIALNRCEHIEASDWRLACQRWLKRRKV